MLLYAVFADYARLRAITFDARRAMRARLSCHARVSCQPCLFCAAYMPDDVLLRLLPRAE